MNCGRMGRPIYPYSNVCEQKSNRTRFEFKSLTKRGGHDNLMNTLTHTYTHSLTRGCAEN